MLRLASALTFLLLLNAALADSRPNDFITRAVESHLFEVQAGVLAQKRGASEGVKKFGALLAADHTSSARNSERVASEIGAPVPQSPSGTQRDLLAAMEKLQGDKFDDFFVKSMLEDHLRDLQRYETQAKLGKDPVSTYAAETLPVLREHAKALQGLQNERATR